MSKRKKAKAAKPNLAAIEEELRELTFEKGQLAYHEVDRHEEIDNRIAKLQIEYVKAGG